MRKTRYCLDGSRARVSDHWTVKVPCTLCRWTKSLYRHSKASVTRHIHRRQMARARRRLSMDSHLDFKTRPMMQLAAWPLPPITNRKALLLRPHLHTQPSVSFPSRMFSIGVEAMPDQRAANPPSRLLGVERDLALVLEV